MIDGSNNIEIGNPGTPADTAKIRIGALGVQQSVYVAGVANAKVTGSAVYVTPDGQLGVLASSQRYKTDITPMGNKTRRLSQLHPVTFHLQSDAEAGLQYGLVAESVAQVYPELVTRDASGTIEGVRYEELTPMLLNEVQKQQRTIALQGAALRKLQRQLQDLQQRLPKSE